MSAIITDQFRISNTLDFVDRVSSGRDSYYLFTGLSNPEDYDSNWDSSPPAFRDCLNEENKIWETTFSLKKISPSDVRPVIRKYEWQSGVVYDMYNHIVNVDRPSFSSSATSLYSSRFYVINKDFRVYICLNNGYDPLNKTGKPSLDEPTFVDLEPRAAGNSGDGYLWKYLYTISPNDILKFDSTNYIPVPIDWFTSDQYKEIRDNASPTSGSGQLKVVLVNESGSDLGNPGTYTNIPILGDGTGGQVAIVIGSNRQVERVFVTSGGSGYSYGKVDLSGTNFKLSNPPEFEVIIPPSGGHGADIYRELGPRNVLVYSRLENDLQDPDFIVGNKIARIGIIQNPKAYDSTAILSKNRASALKALKIKSPDNDTVIVKPNAYFMQNVGSGSTAIGRVASYDRTTGILKYWQDREMVGASDSDSPSSIVLKNKLNFSSPGEIMFESTVGEIDDNFSGNTLVINNNTYYLGQNYQNGLANPEVSPYTGEVIYVDNRPSINRSLNQKEDIKIILQF